MDSYENNFEKELQLLHEKIDEIENKYFFFKDYKVVIAALAKAGIEEIKLTKEEIENNKAVYMLENKKDGNEVVLKRC